MGEGKDVILFGQGELAELAAYYLHNDSDLNIAAVTVDAEYVREDSFAGHPVVPFEDVPQRFRPDSHMGFVAVGYSEINHLRQRKCEAFRALGFELASYISTRAIVSPDFQYGWNCLVLESNIIQPFVKVGDGVTLWSGSHIGHHATIGDFTFVSSHVVLSGGVSVGSNCFLGVNTTTNDHISIGSRCVIGSGALVTQDVADDAVLVAEPARVSPVPSHRLKKI